jgi:hypothetical protein
MMSISSGVDMEDKELSGGVPFITFGAMSLTSLPTSSVMRVSERFFSENIVFDSVIAA